MIKLEPLLRFTNGVTVRAIGKTPFGDTLFMAQVQFETGDARYAWLNETLAVAEARETSSGVEYQLYALSHG